MMNKDNNIIIVRGAGDIATGVIKSLYDAGFRVLALEAQKPSAIRRQVALSEAVYSGKTRVEDIISVFCNDITDIYSSWDKGLIPVIIDEKADIIKKIKPLVLVDAILAKKNIGTNKEMAEFTIALGPGFMAGEDVDVVIETMRGHNLGRSIYTGSALANTGTPGLIAGFGKERVIHANATGRLKIIKDIGNKVEKGETIANILDDNGESHNVSASLNGIIRGMIRDGFFVSKGLKIADIDPRDIEINNCYTISDKARCLGGSVLQEIMKHFK